MRWKWLTFWGVAGLAMLVSSFWVDWFRVDFTYFRLNVGWFAVVYAGLLAYRNIAIQEHIQLSARELHDWGDDLAEATPLILHQAREGRRPRDIAGELEKARGIPPLVSLKYMAALTGYLKKSGKDPRKQDPSLHGQEPSLPGQTAGCEEQVVGEGSDGHHQNQDQQQHEEYPSP